MKRRVLVLMLGMIVFLCATLSGCLGSSKPKSLDKYWNASLTDEKKDENGEITYAEVRIWGLTEEGKQQTFLVLPKEIAGYRVTLLEGPNVIAMTIKDIDFGKVRGLVIEGKIDIYFHKTFGYADFAWIYSGGTLIKEKALDWEYSKIKYPIIYPDSYDIHNKIKDKEGKIYTDYDEINFKSLSENIKEYKTEDGELWSKFTDETNLVFEESLKLYNGDLIIIASEEMASITFPESLKKINKLRIIPSEKQPEGTKIAVNIPSTTTVDKDAFEGNSEIIEIVRY